MSKSTRRLRAGVPSSLAKSAATDSYYNPNARLGLGTNNLASQGGHVLTRVGNNYQLMLALYCDSWIIRKAVDAFPEDMLKDLPRLTGGIVPGMIGKFDKALGITGTSAGLLQALKWGRLFGGGIALMAIKGHDDLSQPLDLDDIEPGAYRGLIPLDRWSGISADSSELIDSIDYPREFGLPKYYRLNGSGSTGPASQRVHHSRVLRFGGRELPRWEMQARSSWGLPEPELIYEELQKRDYINWNVVSLISRAQILTYRDDQLSQAKSGLGKTSELTNQYYQTMMAISDAMNNQGMLITGEKGGVDLHSTSFGGLADIMQMVQMDICGATEYSISRLFGRTATGLGQTGDADNEAYESTCELKRAREVMPQIEKLYPVVAMSTWGMIPDEFEYAFPPIRTVSDMDRAALAEKTIGAIVATYSGNLVTKRQAVQAIKASSGDHGIFSGITDEEAAAVENKYASETGLGELDLNGLGEPKEEGEQEKEQRGVAE